MGGQNRLLNALNIMEADRQCPRCGTPLPQDAPEGLCPACLAKAGLGTEPGSTQASPSSRPKPPPPSPQDIARHFPQLEILELIGQGGMGIVYKARQPKLDRLVALKILPLESGKDPAFAERFSREARALARLNHPNIIAVYDFGEAEGLFYFLMEFVDGLDLRQLEQSRQLTAEQALAIVPKICDALQFAHEEGIVHRDIKPGNILIDRKGRVKIADFGLAKLLGSTAPDLTLTGSGRLMGTPHYMAPEQIDRPQEVDHRADIYSLGVVFYEMLTGELPVGRFAAPSQRVQVDVRLDDVVLRALENKPERRYQHASEVKTDVESITGSPPPQLPALPIRVTGPSVATGGHPGPQDQVRVPSFALMVYASVNLITLAIPLFFGLSRAVMLFDQSPVGGFPVQVWPLGFLPLPVFWLASQICLLIGAAKLRNLSSYGWALAAAVLALLPIGSLWLVGLGLGIWTLIVIHRPDVKAAFSQIPPQFSSGIGTTWSGTGPAIPIFSRKAIVGACLLSVPFVLGGSSVLPLNVGLRSVTSVEFAPQLHHSSPVFLGLFAITPVLVGIAVTSTLLGITAIKDIRYSNGRIVGLALALTDALFFPLIILDALVLGFAQLAVRQSLAVYGFAERIPSIVYSERGLGFILGLLLCVGLDYVIIRACWRAARKPVS